MRFSRQLPRYDPNGGTRLEKVGTLNTRISAPHIDEVGLLGLDDSLAYSSPQGHECLPKSLDDQVAPRIKPHAEKVGP